MSPPLTRCPRCGSTDGYEYRALIGMYGCWGEAAESSGIDERPLTCTCSHCGFRLTIKRASNEED